MSLLLSFIVKAYTQKFNNNFGIKENLIQIIFHFFPAMIILKQRNYWERQRADTTKSKRNHHGKRKLMMQKFSTKIDQRGIFESTIDSTVQVVFVFKALSIVNPISNPHYLVD